MTEPYVPGLDVGALTAIDVHTHAETDGCGHYSLPEELRAGADTYFGVDGDGPPTLDQLAATTATARWPRWCSPSMPSRRSGTPGSPTRP